MYLLFKFDFFYLFYLSLPNTNPEIHMTCLYSLASIICNNYQNNDFKLKTINIFIALLKIFVFISILPHLI